jgi:cyclin-dependent kinase 7
LRALIHPNIVKLIDAYVSERVLYLVLEFCDTDLEQVIRDRSIFLAPADVKSYCLMMLAAVSFCHEHFILHRDIKPANLLISADGMVKLADFGLARSMASPGNKLTHEVATSWYRSPELLFGCTNYSFGPDAWSCGCVLGELLLRSPVFPGESDTNQLQKIFALLGTPVPEDWPGLTSLPNYLVFESRDPLPREDWMKLLAGHSAETLNLLLEMLSLDPSRRLLPTAALQHQYFHAQPAPTTPGALRLPGTLSTEKVGDKRLRDM